MNNRHLLRSATPWCVLTLVATIASADAQQGTLAPAITPAECSEMAEVTGRSVVLLRRSYDTEASNNTAALLNPSLRGELLRASQRLERVHANHLPALRAYTNAMEDFDRQVRRCARGAMR